MNRPLILTAAAAMLFVAGCQSDQVKDNMTSNVGTVMPTASTKAEYTSALKSAESSLKAAHAAGNEWRDTGKLIKKAEADASKDDYAGAIKTADKAEFQAREALSQAQANRDAGNPSYLYTE